MPYLLIWSKIVKISGLVLERLWAGMDYIRWGWGEGCHGVLSCDSVEPCVREGSQGVKYQHN